MLKPFLFSLLALAFTFVSNPSIAKDQDLTHVGHVVAIQGDCTMSIDGKAPVKLSKNDQIIENSFVSTQTNSFIAIELSDHSQVKLGSNAKLKFAYSAKDSEKVDLDLKMGVVKSLVKKRLDSGRWFKIHANAATMGVRGTEFVTSLLPGDGNQMREEVQVIHGSVQVSDRAGKALAMVKAGMGLSLRSLSQGPQGPQIIGNIFQPVHLNSKQVEAIKSEKFLVAPKMLEPMAKANSSRPENQMPPGKVPSDSGKSMHSNLSSKNAPPMKEMRHTPPRKMQRPAIALPGNTLPNAIQPQRPPALKPPLPPPPPPSTTTTTNTTGTSTNK